AIGLDVHALLAGDALDVLAVLVRAGEEEGVPAAQPARPGQRVRGHRRVGVPGVRHVVDVVDGRRMERGLLHRPRTLSLLAAHGVLSAWYAARAAAQTSFTGRAAARARARQSSNSGATLVTRPSLFPTFTAMGPNSVSTSTNSRSSTVRCHSCQRTPSVVVSAKSTSSMAARLSGSAIAVSSTPGRPFFICTGV